MASAPKPVPERAEPKAIEPSDINSILDRAHEAMRRGQARDLAEMQARHMDADHAQALAMHYVIERERLDPEGCDRERRADRREAEQS
jgi:uncharacterized protein involved in copper resistance